MVKKRTKGLQDAIKDINQVFCLISLYRLPSPVIYSPHITSFVLYRWDFPFASFASSGVYFIKSEKLTHSGEAWVVQRCVWCSFIIMVMVEALEWAWSKVRGSAWLIWRHLTPPCPRRWGSCWSWETRAWSVHRGSKHTKATFKYWPNIFVLFCKYMSC